MSELLVNLDIKEFLVTVRDDLENEFGSEFAEIVFFPIKDDLSESKYRDLPVPALLFDLYLIEPTPDQDLKTEQLAVDLKMVAFLAYPADHPRVQIVIREMAARIAAYIFKQSKFGMPVGEAIIENIQFETESELTEYYVVWCVEWRHGAVLGTSVFDTDSQKPTNVRTNLSLNKPETHSEIIDWVSGE